MKPKLPDLQTQLRAMVVAPPPAAAAPQPVAAIKPAKAKAQQRITTIQLYPLDEEIIDAAIRAGADSGYRLNCTQAIRVLMRQGRTAHVTPADYEAVLADDQRRGRRKAVTS